MWKARAVQWQNAGIKVQTVAPKEGVPMYVSGFVMPKNAPNKDGAYAWLDAMMAPSAQEGFAVDMGYNPTVTNAKVPDDVQKRIGFTAEEQKRLVDLDYAYMAKNDVGLPGLVEQVVQGLTTADDRHRDSRTAPSSRSDGARADRRGAARRRRRSSSRSRCWRRSPSCSATA